MSKAEEKDSELLVKIKQHQRRFIEECHRELDAAPFNEETLQVAINLVAICDLSQKKVEKEAGIAHHEFNLIGIGIFTASDIQSRAIIMAVLNQMRLKIAEIP